MKTVIVFVKLPWTYFIRELARNVDNVKIPLFGLVFLMNTKKIDAFSDFQYFFKVLVLLIKVYQIFMNQP